MVVLLLLHVFRYILLCGYRPFYASCGKGCGFSEGLPCEDCQVSDSMYDNNMQHFVSDVFSFGSAVS